MLPPPLQPSQPSWSDVTPTPPPSWSDVTPEPDAELPRFALDDEPTNPVPARAWSPAPSAAVPAASPATRASSPPAPRVPIFARTSATPPPPAVSTARPPAAPRSEPHWRLPASLVPVALSRTLPPSYLPAPPPSSFARFAGAAFVMAMTFASAALLFALLASSVQPAHVDPTIGPSAAPPRAASALTPEDPLLADAAAARP